MNKMSAKPGDDLPEAATRRRSWSFPWVWMVPMVAALVAGYLVFQHVRESGPTITIRFRDASGVNPGQTPVRYRGAEIGQVDSIALSDHLQFATVRVALRRHAASIAREDSTFWIVRPNVGMGNLTGLGTILTGPYIAVLPGSGSPAKLFTGAETSPEVIDPEGLKVVLLADHGGSLRTGAPIYYRGIEVGAVRETKLGTNSAAVEVDCVIRRRFAALVRCESKFWNVTGLDMHFGLFSGAEVNVESLKSLFVGGIAFATPEEFTPGSVPKEMVFVLHDDVDKKWLKWSPRISIPEENEEGGERETAANRAVRLPQLNAP